MGTKYLTAAEVAELLKVKRLTVYRWIESGKLPATKVGRKFLISQSVIDEFVFDAIDSEATNEETELNRLADFLKHIDLPKNDEELSLLIERHEKCLLDISEKTIKAAFYSGFKKGYSAGREEAILAE